LFTELSLARDALARGWYTKAQRIVAGVLTRLSGPGTSGDERAVSASARAIAAMAEFRLGDVDGAKAHLAAAAMVFETLIGEGHELDVQSRTDYIRTVLLAGEAHAALALVTRCLESGSEVPVDVILRLAARLREDGAVSESVDLLRLAHRQRPLEVAVAVDFALALELRGPSGDAGPAHLFAAVLLAHDGEYRRAEEHFRRSIAVHPHSSAATVGLAQVLVEQGRLDEAIKVIRDGLQRHPATPEVVAVRAHALALAGDVVGAVRVAQAGIDDFGEIRPLSDVLVRLLLAFGQVDEAASVAQRGLQRDPSDPEMHLARARVLLARSRATEAAAVLRPLVAEYPESVDPWLVLVRALAVAGETIDAAETLSHALAEHPEEPELMREREWLIAESMSDPQALLDNADDPRSLRVLEGVLALEPGNGEAHAWLGELLLRRKDLEAALGHLDRAVVILRDSGWVVGTRGQVLAAMGRTDEALDVLRDAARLDDSLWWVHAEMGDAYRVQGRYREALDELTRATEMAPASAWAWAARGATEQLVEQWEQARTSLEEAIRLAPDYPWALAVKGNLHRDIDELDEALDALDRSVGLDPDNPWAWGLRAWVLSMLDADPQSEEAAAREGVERDPDDHYLHLRLGEALIRQGRDHEAAAEFRSAIDLAATRLPMDSDVVANVAWSHLRLGDCTEAVSLLTAFVAREYSNIPVQFDLGLALLCADRTEVALDQYESAASMVRALDHAGRRRHLMRVARHDLHAFVHGGRIDDADVRHIEQVLDGIRLVEEVDRT
jgi:tetratricopeptide (TPR) repeat protein